MPGIQQRLAAVHPATGAQAVATAAPTTATLPPATDPVDESSDPARRLIENSCLYLPSDLLKLDRDNGPVDLSKPEEVAASQARADRWNASVRAIAPGLVDAEVRLRKAQCTDSIDALRTKIYMRSRLLQYKRLNARHQGATTRARDALSSVDKKIQLLAAKYNAARDALMSLVGRNADWEGTYSRRYLPLRKEDIRALEDDDPATARKKKKMRKEGPAEGRRLVSWIWRGIGAADSDDMNTSKHIILIELYLRRGLLIDGDTGVRIEWMKARARTLRWEEELELIPEEARRAMAYFEWHARQWEERAAARDNVDPELQEGLAAYATAQAAIRRGLRARFAMLWDKTLAGVDVDEGEGEGDGDGEGSASDDAIGTDPDCRRDDDDDGVIEIEETEDVVAYLELDADEAM